MISGPEHGRQLVYYTNQEGRKAEVLSPGSYGLSNQQLDSPWGKVTHGKQRFSEILSQGADSQSKEELTSQLLQLLDDRTWCVMRVRVLS